LGLGIGDRIYSLYSIKIIISMCVCVCVCVGSCIMFLRPGGAVSRWHWQTVMAFTERDRKRKAKTVLTVTHKSGLMRRKIKVQ